MAARALPTANGLCDCGHPERDHQGYRAKCWHWVGGYRRGVTCVCVGWKPNA